MDRRCLAAFSPLFNSLKPGPSGQGRVNRLCQSLDLSVHFFARPKKRTKKKTPVAFGPSDFFALLKAAGNFQTRFAQTVKIPFRHLFRCSTNTNGKYNKLAPYRGNQNRAFWARIFICRKEKVHGFRTTVKIHLKEVCTYPGYSMFLH